MPEYSHICMCMMLQGKCNLLNIGHIRILRNHSSKNQTAKFLSIHVWSRNDKKRPFKCSEMVYIAELKAQSSGNYVNQGDNNITECIYAIHVLNGVWKGPTHTSDSSAKFWAPERGKRNFVEYNCTRM